MIEKNVREQIIALMKREVVPAVGCTEPMAVALCVARATEALGNKPEKITALLSARHCSVPTSSRTPWAWASPAPA